MQAANPEVINPNNQDPDITEYHDYGHTNESMELWKFHSMSSNMIFEYGTVISHGDMRDPDPRAYFSSPTNSIDTITQAFQYLGADQTSHGVFVLIKQGNLIEFRAGLAHPNAPFGVTAGHPGLAGNKKNVAMAGMLILSRTNGNNNFNFFFRSGHIPPTYEDCLSFLYNFIHTSCLPEVGGKQDFDNEGNKKLFHQLYNQKHIFYDRNDKSFNPTTKCYMSFPQLYYEIHKQKIEMLIVNSGSAPKQFVEPTISLPPSSTQIKPMTTFTFDKNSTEKNSSNSSFVFEKTKVFKKPVECKACAKPFTLIQERKCAGCNDSFCLNCVNSKKVINNFSNKETYQYFCKECV